MGGMSILFRKGLLDLQLSMLCPWYVYAYNCVRIIIAKVAVLSNIICLWF